MATKSKSATTEEDDVEVEAQAADAPEINPTAISTKETDFCGRLLVTPGTNSKDYLGRQTTATADYLGRLLLDTA